MGEGRNERYQYSVFLSDYKQPVTEDKAIMKETNLLPSHFTTERMQELAREYRFPLEPEKAVVNLAYENGMNVINSDPQLAVYYLKIASDLAESDEIRNGLIMAQKLTEEQTAGKHGDNDI